MAITGITSSIADYVKQEGFSLIVKSIVSNNTISKINLITGLKGTALVPFLTTTTTLKAGGSCGTFSGAGNNGAFSEVEIAVKPVLYESQLCIPALENKELLYETANPNSEIPFANVFLGETVKGIQHAIEKLVWLGDVSSDPFDGIVEAATNASLLSTITGSTSNVYDAIDLAIDTAFTADASFEEADDVVIFMNYAKYRTYAKELVAKDYFNYSAKGVEDLSSVFPGTKVRIIPSEGLAGNSFLYLVQLSHIHAGTNLASDKEGLTTYFDFPTNSVMLRSSFFMGIGVSKTVYKKAI